MTTSLTHRIFVIILVFVIIAALLILSSIGITWFCRAWLDSHYDKMHDDYSKYVVFVDHSEQSGVCFLFTLAPRNLDELTYLAPCKKAKSFQPTPEQKIEIENFKENLTFTRLENDERCVIGINYRKEKRITLPCKDMKSEIIK